MPVPVGSSMQWLRERKTLGLCTACDEPRLPSTSRCSAHVAAARPVRSIRSPHQVCIQCNKPVVVRPERAVKYCSRDCYHEASRKPRLMFDCKHCGGEIQTLSSALYKGRRLYCSNACRNNGRRRAIGSVTVCSNGYAKIKVAEGKWRAEHVVRMEQALGRRLLPGEEVHHVNGIKHDNRPANLELWSSSHPAGQRVIDKVAWAKEILGLYEPEALKE